MESIILFIYNIICVLKFILAPVSYVGTDGIMSLIYVYSFDLYLFRMSFESGFYGWSGYCLQHTASNINSTILTEIPGHFVIGGLKTWQLEKIILM